MAKTKPTNRRPSRARPYWEQYYVHVHNRNPEYVFQHGRDRGLTWEAVQARNAAERVQNWVDADFEHWLQTNVHGVREAGVWVR